MFPSASDPSTSEQSVSFYIDGNAIHSKCQFSILNPVDNKQIWTFSCATIDQAKEAADAADAANGAWAATYPRDRGEILSRAADLFLPRQTELEGCMKLETAADDDFIAFNIDTTARQLKDVASRVTTIQGSFLTVDDSNRSAVVVKEPTGVILAIAPWNAPYILGVRSISAAFATGNRVVLKGSEPAPKCNQYITEIFHEAGLPKGCLNLVFAAPGEAGGVVKSPVGHPAIRKVNFTGSIVVWSSIASTTGKYLKPVLLELGSKATAIVFEDADLKKAAKACLLGGLLNSGQVCMNSACDELLGGKIIKPIILWE